MPIKTQDVRKEIVTGLYLRVKAQIRLWSWGKEKSANLTQAETERPWAGLAEWLRVAHSLLYEKAMELTRNPD